MALLRPICPASLSLNVICIRFVPQCNVGLFRFFTGKGVEIGSNVAVASKDATGSVLSKTAEVGSNLVGSIPLPAKLKGKDKKE